MPNVGKPKLTELQPKEFMGWEFLFEIEFSPPSFQERLF